MKKPIQIVICVLLVAAIVCCVVLYTQKNDLSAQLQTANESLSAVTNDLMNAQTTNATLTKQIADLESVAKEAAAALEASEAKATELQTSLDTIKERLTDGTSEMFALLGISVDDLLAPEAEAAVEETAEEAAEETSEATEAEAEEDTTEETEEAETEETTEETAEESTESEEATEESEEASPAA